MKLDAMITPELKILFYTNGPLIYFYLPWKGKLCGGFQLIFAADSVIINPTLHAMK